MPADNKRATDIVRSIVTSEALADKRRLFYAALDSGMRPTQAARSVGISRPTAFKWKKQRREQAIEDENKRALLVHISKADAESKLAQIAQEGAPEDSIKAIGLLGKFRDWEAARKSVNLNIQAPPGWDAWARELDRRVLGLPDEQPQIASHPNSDTSQHLLSQGIATSSHNGSYRTPASPSADGVDLAKAPAGPQTGDGDAEELPAKHAQKF